jgi:transcriptional regulator with XRE-family HTH domain
MVMAAKQIPLGPTGETVRSRVTQLRDKQNLTYAKLARRCEDAGRPIPVLGLRRIEAGERRVDVDDLMGLAAALEVSPTYLLGIDANIIVQPAAAVLKLQERVSRIEARLIAEGEVGRGNN